MPSIDVEKGLRNFQGILSEIDNLLKLQYGEGDSLKNEIQNKIKINLMLSFEDSDSKWKEFINSVHPQNFPSGLDGNEPQSQFLATLQKMRQKVSSYIQELELIKSYSSDEPEEITLLKLHLAQGESTNVEFKQDFPPNAKELADNIASFATSNAGFIYLGIDRNGGILGFPNIDTPSQRDELQLRILGVTSMINPRVQLKIDFLKSDSKNIIRIIIPKGVEPIYYSNNVPYIRELSSSRPATDNEVKECHRAYFETNRVPTAETKNQQSLRSLALMLSDAELALSDTEDHYPGITRQQLQYDLGTIADGLLPFLSNKIMADLSIDDKLKELTNKLTDMNHYKFYLGEVYYTNFSNIALEGLHISEKISPQVIKNIVMNPSSHQEFIDILNGTLNRIKEQWKISKEFRIEEADVQGTRDYFRIIAYEIHRLAYFPESRAVSENLIAVSKKFRKLSTLDAFGLSKIGFDNIEHVAPHVEWCIAELEKAVNTLST